MAEILAAKEKELSRVLIVDDEENVLRSLRRLCMDEDFETFTATSGREGLELVRKHEFAVILSDQRMPEMGGAEFLEKTRGLSPNSVRIILTGYADINAAINAINRGGAYMYLSKPWDDNNLLLTVRDAVQRYRLLKENKYLTELTRKQNEKLEKWNAELEFHVQKQTIELSRQNKELEKLLEKGRKNLRDFITAFSNLIELRDKTLQSHSKNVASLAASLAARLGLGSSETETISIAAYLHDIGKVGIPDIALIKEISELSPEELRDYRKHPVTGQSAIDSIEDFREIGALIRHHHEGYNGKGFPDRLKGKDIPLGARILAIADKFDSLVGGAYTTAAAEGALKTIHSLLHSQFDPALYESLEAVVRENTKKFSAASCNMEMEIGIKDLVTGMVLSKDMRSGTGLLLLSKGTTLDAKNVETIKRSYYLDPSKTGVFVLVKHMQS